MCSRPPTPPPPPPPRPTAPAPEKTAKKVGKAAPVNRKKNQPGAGVQRRGGTSSLQIQPLSTGSNTDLNL